MIHRDKGFTLYAKKEKFFMVINSIFYVHINKRKDLIEIAGNINPNWHESYIHQFILTPVFELYLRSCGFFTLHASAVSKGRNCTMILGDSGSGKTVNSLKMTEQRWKFMGDDTVIIDQDLNVYPFLKPVHLSSESISVLNGIKKVKAPLFGKGAYQVGLLLHRKDICISGKKLDRIIFLEKFSDKTVSRNITDAAAFKKILSYSLIPSGRSNDAGQIRIIENISNIQDKRSICLKKGIFLSEI